jgi:hypothetical protein
METMPPSPENHSATNGTGPAAQGPTVPWDKVRFAAPEDWVEDEPYDPSVRAKEGAHITYLAWSRQAHVESSTSFHVTVARLETPLAVQNESQWRIPLDPRFQSVTIHWLRVVRNGTRIDQLRRDKMRLIQRETQLEHHIINGCWTFLVVLEDVRQGDLIEAAYSYTSTHPICADWSETFFAVPSFNVVGRFHLSVLFDPGSVDMTSRAAAGSPPRSDSKHAGGLTRWNWEGSQLTPLDPEPNQPTSHLDYLWIQVVNIGSWAQIARRVAEVWTGVGHGEGLEGLSEFCRPASVDFEAVTTLVRFIQDEFRYLSIDLATGGWVPASPGKVARQRHGDCKDLVWLTTVALRRWGVAARPILVGSGLRDSVSNFLPSSILFNHAVLEVEVAGKKRWFDMTLRNQGGDYMGQPVNWFGVGLPVDEGATDLVQQSGARSRSIYMICETINIDTRKDRPWFVEQRYWAEGFQAENLRRVRLAQGVEGFAAERLRQARLRYGTVARIGSLQWRDHRARNSCEVIEAFEVGSLVSTGENGNRSSYDVPLSVIAQHFGIPQGKKRRGPLNMPYPIVVVHKLSVKSPSMGTGSTWRRKWSCPEFTGMLKAEHEHGQWSRTSRYEVNVPEIAACRVDTCRELLTDFLKAAGWRVYLPLGKPLGDTPGNFGKLPPEDGGSEAYVAGDNPADYPEATPGKDNTPNEFSPKNRWRRWMRQFGPSRLSAPLYWLFFVILMGGIARSCAPASHY